MFPSVPLKPPTYQVLEGDDDPDDDNFSTKHKTLYELFDESNQVIKDTVS